MPSTLLYPVLSLHKPPLSANVIYCTVNKLSLRRYIPPLAGDGDALGVDGALVGVEVEHLILGPRPRRHVQQVATDLHAKRVDQSILPTF